ncbi:hypothetical protein [Psychromarinibacter sp. S121]|uniref:hypothetical protein n=1 Tax=Psychromarinibacter sp. S121 TaxID=3415127 RepID=UPI003C7CD7FC
MRKSVAALAVLCLLAACDGNPLLVEEEDVIDDGTDEEDGVETNGAGIPTVLSNNLESVVYDPAARRLFVTISGLDGTPEAVEYDYNSAATAGLPAGHFAFTQQEDALDRFFTGIVKESSDESARAVIVSDGGQFNRFFWGGHYERDGDFDPPSSGDGPGEGQVSYAGDYVGLDNYSGPVPPQNTDPTLQPQAPGRVVGSAFVNVNFEDMQINGSVFNRQTIDNPTLPELRDIVMIVTEISEDGTFLGELEFDNGDDATGNYGGIFGGNNASSVAGLLGFIPDPDDPNSWETGMFVLTQCGLAGDDAALCVEAAPN